MKIDINKITDIQELKALKSDEHDRHATAHALMNQAAQNISQIVTRINELQKDESKTEDKSVS